MRPVCCGDFNQEKHAVHGNVKMDSPERSEGISAPVDQGSPFYKYLCGLSPIKSAKSVHVLQTYAEHYLPPPPAVFSSPANPDKSGGRAKRGLLSSRSASTQVAVSTWEGDPEIQPTQPYIRRSFPAGHVDAGNATALVASEYSQQHILCHKLDPDQKTEGSGDIPSNYECGDVNDFLADPHEEGLYATGSSPQLVAKCQLDNAPSLSQDCEYADGEHLAEAVNEESMSTGSQDRLDHCDDAANNVQRNSDAMHGVSDVTGHCQVSEREDRRESLASRASGSGSDHEGSGHTNVERLSGLDQAMAALLRSGQSEGFNGNEWAVSQQDLSDFSSHQASAIERIPDPAQYNERDDFDFDSSQTLTIQRNAGPEIEDMELEDRKDFLVCGTLSQRGVRRRCLDFETSVRRKSMGGGGSRKSFGLRSKTLPGTSAATSASSIPSSVLCERAVATSDATNSAAETAAALETHSDISLRHDSSLAGSRGLSPALARLSRCSSLRGTETVSTDLDTVDPARSGRECGNAFSSLGGPSGIGLHLNSLTSSFPFSPTNRDFKHTVGIASGPNGAVASLLGVPGVTGMAQDKRSEDFGSGVVNVRAGCNSFSTGSTATSSFSAGGVVISVMERSRVTLRETVMDTPRTMMTSSTLQSLTVGGRQSLEGSRITRASALDRKLSSSGKKRFPGQDGLHPVNVDLLDECDSPRSPKRRRKSPTESGEKSGDGCKRCNCKKSKCLKLYCECFAAGTYCNGSCTCHDCFNKPEHTETVTQTRNQITSRNPLAFAPKIVLSKDASPKQGVQVEMVVETPSQAAARHKRGCNCKKSLCLKKYCECYQAGVGCSEGCRCEGCKNIYGQKKEAAEVSDEKDMASDVLESRSSESELEHARAGSLADVGSLDQPCNNGKDLSPITPSFQYTGQGRTVGRLRSAGKRLSSSPLSQSQSLPKPAPSPSSSARSSINFQSGEGFRQTTDMLNLSRSSPMTSTPKLSRLNQLSPRWDGLGDICTLTPLPQPPLRPTPASLSTLDRTGASPSFSMEPISSYQPDKLDSVNKASPPPFRQPSHQSPVSSYAARHCQNPSKQGVPSTPDLSSAYVEKDGTKAAVAQVTSFLCEDEDLPDFLRYPDGINSPVVTKSGSPKQKRVSPPHCEGMGDRRREDGSVLSRSSPNLRSGRKITLQALPPIPSKAQLADPRQGQASSFAK